MSHNVLSITMLAIMQWRWKLPVGYGWTRSENKHGLQYTGFLSDGDSKAHKAVCELNVYEKEIVKEECFNHVHKRMGHGLVKK